MPVAYLLSSIVAAVLVGTFTPESFAGEPYRPKIKPSEFSATVNHPYFTLTPGTTFTYRAQDREGTEINKVIVTNRTKEVMGVTTRVVWDRVWLNGRLIEETYDWYAQDRQGNVWYFGEDSKEYENGRAASTKGSWEAGVHGAQPGIAMPAKLTLGAPYRQEYKKGEAEDMGKIVSTKATVKVPYGSFGGCVKTEDWSALERGHVEHKLYSKEVGQVVLETENHDRKRVELIEVKSPRGSKGPSRR